MELFMRGRAKSSLFRRHFEHQLMAKSDIGKVVVFATHGKGHSGIKTQFHYKIASMEILLQVH
jgi:hypothetical protein